jgi:hypothetical protein
LEETCPHLVDGALVLGVLHRVCYLKAEFLLVHVVSFNWLRAKKGGNLLFSVRLLFLHGLSLSARVCCYSLSAHRSTRSGSERIFSLWYFCLDIFFLFFLAFFLLGVLFTQAHIFLEDSVAQQFYRNFDVSGFNCS